MSCFVLENKLNGGKDSGRKNILENLSKNTSNAKQKKKTIKIEPKTEPVSDDIENNDENVHNMIEIKSRNENYMNVSEGYSSIPSIETNEDSIVLRVDDNWATETDYDKSEAIKENKLKPDVALSPVYSSTSSENYSTTSFCDNLKKKKRKCIFCNITFKHRKDFLEHHKKHISLPNLIINRLSTKDLQFQEYMKRRKQVFLCARKKIRPPNFINRKSESIPKASVMTQEGTGIRLKIKMSGLQNFQVFSNCKENIDLNEDKKMSKDPVKILPAKEVTDISSSSKRSNQKSNATIVTKTSVNTESDFANTKVHFECPTLDGLDQFNEEANKESTAAILKQLLEYPQMPQEHEWNNTSSNEFISIDKLVHICTICHSNFSDAVTLHEHKRKTGHNVQEPFTTSLPSNSNELNTVSQNIIQAVEPQRIAPTLTIPMEQIAHHVRNIPLQLQPQQVQQEYQHLQEQHLRMQKQLIPVFPHEFLSARRPPPPLYRVPSSQQFRPPEMLNPHMIGLNSYYNMNGHQQRPENIHRISVSNGMNGGTGLLMPGGFRFSSLPERIPYPQNNGRSILKPSAQIGSNLRPSVPPQSQVRAAVQMLANKSKRSSSSSALNSNLTPSPPLIQNYHPSKSSSGPTPPSKKLKPNSFDNPRDSKIISVQPRTDGIPIIQSVQGGASSSTLTPESNTSSVPRSGRQDTIQITDQITLSVKNKDKCVNTKNPNDVANILTNRGITVTPSGKQKESLSSIINSSSLPENAVEKLELNSSVSIITKKKPIPVIDVTDDSKDNIKIKSTPSVSKLTTQLIQPTVFLTCPQAECGKKFITQEALNRHTQRGHKTMSLPRYKCNKCPIVFSTADGLAYHRKRMHKINQSSPDELGLPVVNLNNEETKNKLAKLGITNYIALGSLNKLYDGNYGLPIVSVCGSSNPTVCDLISFGANSILSIGPIKQIPMKASSRKKITSNKI